MVPRAFLVITLCYSLVWAIDSSLIGEKFIDVENPDVKVKAEDIDENSKGFSIKLEQKKLDHPHKLTSARQE